MPQPVWDVALAASSTVGATDVAPYWLSISVRTMRPITATGKQYELDQGPLHPAG